MNLINGCLTVEVIEYSVELTGIPPLPKTFWEIWRYLGEDLFSEDKSDKTKRYILAFD